MTVPGYPYAPKMRPINDHDTSGQTTCLATDNGTAADTRPRPIRLTRSLVVQLGIFVMMLFSASNGRALAQVATPDNNPIVVSPQDAPQPLDVTNLISGGPDVWTSPEGLTSALQVMLMLTVLSLAPAILLMTTSFVRVVVVLGLLRQALGTQQLPPGQVLTSIALFITFLVMSPVWKQVYDDAIAPYTDESVEMSLEEAWNKGIAPIRRFMSQQIEVAGNSDDVRLFYEYIADDRPDPRTYEEVPLHVLIPAFMLSELKTAFLIGFQIYLPFLILDIVVASVTISMGMLMLPPVMISLPFKIMLFILVDGWHLVVGMLLRSFSAI